MGTSLATKDAVDDLRDQAAEVERLQAILGIHAIKMLRTMHLLVAATFDVDGFTLDDATARRFLLAAGARAVQVDGTTQEAIRQALARGQALGESNLQLAERIRHLFEVTWKGRAEMVARSELQWAQLRAAEDRYRATGQVHQVEIRVGGTADSDAACGARNGRRVALGTPVDLLHPNCTVAIIPVVSQ